MSHNLNIEKGKVSFASTETAWHGLGTIVDQPMTSKEALVFGGLDYHVEKFNLFDAEGTPVPNQFGTRRTDNGSIFGVVGKKYQVLQNVEAFGFYDALMEEHVKIQSVGALGAGERIFICAKLPHVITVGKNDLTEMYLLLTSTHDGSGAVVAGITPIRVVCQNTLNFAINSGLKNRIAIKHTTSVVDNTRRAGQIMKLSLQYQTSLEQAYNLLFQTKVSDSAARELIKKVIQEEKDDSTRTKNIIQSIESAYNVGVGQKEIVGSAWGLFNGITHFLSHEKGYKDQDTKFKSLLCGGQSEKIVKRSFDVLMDFANN
jgi:phage/plasmid-like protein (TIGR03299 family)